MELSQPMFALMYVPGVSLIGLSIVADINNRPRTYKWSKSLGKLCLIGAFFAYILFLNQLLR